MAQINDLVLRNYHDPAFVFHMEIPDFVEQLLKLQEKELEQKVWEMWLAKWPRMTKDNFVSYEEMLNTAKQQETKHETPVHGCYVDQVFF